MFRINPPDLPPAMWLLAYGKPYDEIDATPYFGFFHLLEEGFLTVAFKNDRIYVLEYACDIFEFPVSQLWAASWDGIESSGAEVEVAKRFGINGKKIYFKSWENS